MEEVLKLGAVGVVAYLAYSYLNSNQNNNQFSGFGGGFGGFKILESNPPIESKKEPNITYNINLEPPQLDKDIFKTDNLDLTNRRGGGGGYSKKSYSVPTYYENDISKEVAEGLRNKENYYSVGYSDMFGHHEKYIPKPDKVLDVMKEDYITSIMSNSKKKHKEVKREEKKEKSKKEDNKKEIIKGIISGINPVVGLIGRFL